MLESKAPITARRKVEQGRRPLGSGAERAALDDVDATSGGRLQAGQGQVPGHQAVETAGRGARRAGGLCCGCARHGEGKKEPQQPVHPESLLTASPY
jgi:hypothetical protein